jgi:hypothetical protein
MLLEGKIIPWRGLIRIRNGWNGGCRSAVLTSKHNGRKRMYIGLGGILVLILILWLLGVI